MNPDILRREAIERYQWQVFCAEWSAIGIALAIQSDKFRPMFLAEFSQMSADHQGVICEVMARMGKALIKAGMVPW